jgi:hypothetical protein
MFRRIAPVVALILGLSLAAPVATRAFAAPISEPATTTVTAPVAAPVTTARVVTYHYVPRAAFGSLAAKARRILRHSDLQVKFARKRIVAKGPAGRVVRIDGPGRPVAVRRRGRWYYPTSTVVTAFLSVPPVPRYKWRPAVYSVYGGPSEAQSVAGPYPSTSVLDRRGFPYFAHKTLPFGTRVIFRGANGRTVIGYCVDRGPYAGNREFDLSPAIANRLGLDGTGTIKCAVIK